MMYWYGNGMNGWGYVFMTISMVAFWSLVIFAIVVGIRYLGRTAQQQSAPTARPTPEQLLAERFARGEIDEHEYQRALDTLRGHAIRDA
jgi:putative membrane protein